MTLVLRLNRGATYGTLDLMDRNDIAGTGNYRVLDTWRPRVATRRPQPINGLIYYDVDETIPLEITGGTAAQCLDAVQDLILALDQAAIWFEEGAERDPVILEYLPDGTSLGAIVNAPVLGTPENAPNVLELAQIGMMMIANGFRTVIDLPLLRRGLWLGSAETPSASSAVANPGAMSVTFSNAAEFPSPCKVTIATSQTPISSGNQGYLFLADESDKIVVVSASVMSPISGSWTTETENHAEGNSVRQTSSFSGTQTLGAGSLSGNSSARLWAVFGAVKNNSAGNLIPWTVYVSLGRTAADASTQNSRATILEADPDIYPKLHFFGLVAIADAFSSLYLYATPGTGGAAGDELRVDYFVLLAMDENTTMIPFDTTTDPVSSYGLDDFIVDDRSLTHPQPSGTINGFHPMTPSFALINNTGTNLTARIAGTYPASGSGHYVINQNLSTTEVSYTLTATRRIGYLFVP